MANKARPASAALKAFIIWLCSVAIQSQEFPTLYEYYSEGGIQSGLVEDGRGFLLNGKPIQVISGSIHYFRIHPDYWRTTLRKLKACGMNAVETYVPWALHEPIKGVYDFGDGDFDMSQFLDLERFLQIAKEEDLFAIVRPGPYICAEFEFGGFPSYLLRDPDMQVRTSYPGFMERVDAFYQRLIPILGKYRWTGDDPGPLIASQIENEYGAFVFWTGDGQDIAYLDALRAMMVDYGLGDTYLLLSDAPIAIGIIGTFDDMLLTANFQGNGEAQMEKLEELQPERPKWAMELWPGWFDHWLDENHQTFPLETTLADLEAIMTSWSGSVNLYMFQGGTNFGFLNGANNIAPKFPFYGADITSYDYDAPLTEGGDYGPKYDPICDFIKANNLNPITALPGKPPENPKMAPAPVEMSWYLTLDDVLDQGVPLYEEPGLVNMENLGSSEQEGQDFGFLLHRKQVLLPEGRSILTFPKKTHDMATVMVNGVHQIPPFSSDDDLRGPGYWVAISPELTLNGTGEVVVLDILLENLGRINYGGDYIFADQRKGFTGEEFLLNDEPIADWELRPLTLKSSWIRQLTGWRPKPADGFPPDVGPTLMRAELVIDAEGGEDPLPDTWIHLWETAEEDPGWHKGAIFVNGFNLGRYWDAGPQRTLYLPGPLLRDGVNEIIVFEIYRPGNSIHFTDYPILETSQE